MQLPGTRRSGAAALALLAAALASGIAGCQADSPILAREASEVFLESGDFLDRLPELVAQLEIPAGINVGALPHEGYFVTDPKDGQLVLDCTRPRPERTTARFEFAGGAVGQALDAFCKLNPGLRWRLQGGVVVLERRTPNSANLDALLNRRIPKFECDKQPMKDAVESTGRALYEVWPSPPDEDWTWRILFTYPLLLENAPRLPVDVPISTNLADATVRQILAEVVRQVPHTFWFAWDSEREMPDPVKAVPREGIILISRTAPMRRQLDLVTLVRCLDARYEPLHGYTALLVRINNAKRELVRRWHFHPEEVRKALLADNGVTDIIRDGKLYNEAINTLDWALLLNDESLTDRLASLVLGLKDRDRRRECLIQFSCCTGEALQPRYVPMWRELLKDDDPRVRKRAAEMIGWWGKESRPQ
jgi:hypothetical protein